MKILIVTNYLPPKIGGIERISHELASALQKQGKHKVTVASAFWPRKYVKSDWGVIEFPYKVVYFSSITLARRLPIPNFISPNFWKALMILGNEYDLVFFQSHLFILNWVLAFKLRKLKRRIWMNQGCNYVPIDSAFGKVVSFFYERLGMIVMKYSCNEFLGQSRNTSKWISSKTNIPFKTLTNAINLEHFDYRVQDDHYPIQSKVLFVGRFEQGKGLLECCQAVSKANEILRSRGDTVPFELTIIGSGSLESKLTDGDFEINPILKGELEYSQVIATMFESDILIQSYSQPEGLTTVTLEGLSTGMLIVTTPLSGQGDLDGCINYLPGSLAELPYRLIECRTRHEKRSELVTIGRGFVEDRFTWDKVAERLVLGDYSN